MLRKFERCPLIPPPEILSSGKPAPFTLPGSPGSSKVRKFEFHNSICRFIQSYFNSHFGALVDVSADLRQEVESQTPTKRLTKSIRLSRFAAHNAFHHCEQCHAYCEAGPAAQVRPSMPPPPAEALLSSPLVKTHLVCSCRSAPSTLSPSPRPCLERRSSFSFSSLKPRRSTSSSVRRAATWSACVCLWCPQRFVLLCHHIWSCLEFHSHHLLIRFQGVFFRDLLIVIDPFLGSPQQKF